MAKNAHGRAPAVSFPPHPNPKTPRLKVPPGAWDTHFHVIGPPHLFPYVENRWHTPPAAPVEHYLAVAKVLGFERGCTVQSSAHGEDPAVTLDAIRKSEGRLCGVIRADPRLDDAAIRKLHAGGIRGIRIELRKVGRSAEDSRFDPRAQSGIFEGESLARLVEQAARHSWVVALHIDPDSLIALAEVIRRMPGRIIVENFASIDARLGTGQPALRTLLELADEPHIWLKCASTYRMQWMGATYEQVVAVARLVHARAPDRAIWGTDWPHPGMFQPGRMPNDGDLVDTLLDFVPDETMRQKLLVDNPKRLFDSA